ncbi:UNVERIFIED_CONTAM: hypothetical protein ABIC26_001554 [Paenibacillus sp. PvR008]
MLLYSMSTHKPMLLRALPGLFAFSGSEWPPGSMRSGRGICIGLGAGLAARHGGLLDLCG